MLKNASSLAIVGLDTAENGPSKVRQVTNRIDAIIGHGGRRPGRDEPAVRRRNSAKRGRSVSPEFVTIPIKMHQHAPVQNASSTD